MCQRIKQSHVNEKSHKGRQGNFCTIDFVISDEYTAAFKTSMQTKSEYVAAAVLAQDREHWRKIFQNIKQRYCESRKEKGIKQSFKSVKIFHVLRFPINRRTLQ
jgi:hypothetical protein